MTEQELNKLTTDGKIETIKQENTSAIPVGKAQGGDEYQPVLEMLRKVKQPLSAAPTFTPRNFLEQIQIYNNNLYIYVNGTWKYVALT